MGFICSAGDTKSWSFASREAANLLQNQAGEDDVHLYGGIAARRLANDQLFVSNLTKTSPNFSNQTTTFFPKNTELSVPNFVVLIDVVIHYGVTPAPGCIRFIMLPSSKYYP